MIGQDLVLQGVIAATRDVAEAGTACRRIAEALGFQHFLYGLRIAVSLSQPRQFVLSGYPPGWRSRYDEQGFMSIDPVLARGAVSVMPFGWDEIDRTLPNNARLFEEAAAFGLHHGLTVPIHGANGEFGLMSLARLKPLPQGAQRARLLQRAHWITANLQERIRQIVLDAGAVREPRLTLRETECLRHAAQGLKTSAIAGAMHIAESTVVYHLNAAERKLGVKKRSHAIARAVALGAVEPDRFPSRISSSNLIELTKQ